jgi:hypothetical protein
MYFDAVLNKQRQPIFNGTPDAVKKWLEARRDDEEVRESVVCLGVNLRIKTIDEYLSK